MFSCRLEVELQLLILVEQEVGNSWAVERLKPNGGVQVWSLEHPELLWLGFVISKPPSALTAQLFHKIFHKMLFHNTSVRSQTGCLPLGGSLQDVLLENAKLGQYFPEGELKEILLQVSMGLKYIHNSGLVHLDIKPSEYSALLLCGGFSW